jgi:hypothetical protein
MLCQLRTAEPHPHGVISCQTVRRPLDSPGAGEVSQSTVQAWWLKSSDTQIEAQMGKSTYEIRVAGTVPIELLENFRQIESVEPGGTVLRATQLDDAALWGLIDSLREAGIDLIEIRRDVEPGET